MFLYLIHIFQFTLWEGGTRGVAFIHSKMLSKPGTVSSALIHVSDWLPTLLSAAGFANGEYVAYYLTLNADKNYYVIRNAG